MSTLHPAPDAGVLDHILDVKKSDVYYLKERLPLSFLKEQVASLPPTRGFRKALAMCDTPAIIAEVKRASPSKGVLRPEVKPAAFAPEALACAYERGGAAALSVLTDTRFFWGGNELLSSIGAVTQLPRLRKDFIVDAWQLYETRWLGADAVLLMARCLDAEQLNEYASIALEVGLDVLLEVHHESELEAALACDERVVLGINHRDLRTLEMKPGHAKALRPMIPGERICVAESGMESAERIRELYESGFKAFLVGSHPSASDDAEGIVRSFVDA